MKKRCRQVPLSGIFPWLLGMQVVSNHVTAVQTAPTPVPTFFRAKIVKTGIPDTLGSKKSGNGGGGGLYSVSR